MVNEIKQTIIKNKIGILLVAIYLITTYLLFSTTAPTMWLFGFPCPGCGLTRAGFRLMRLDLVGAFHYNPSIFLVPVAVYAYFKKNVPFLAIIIALVIAIFIYRLTTSFGIEPLVINRNALMFRLVEWF